jgi:hypothetical protein
MARHGAQKKRLPIKNDALKPMQLRKLIADALQTSAIHAEPGASIYAAMPSGSLLPHFIAALEDGGFSFKDTLI